MKEFEIAEGGLKRVIAVRLHPGEDVLLRLEQLCREKNLKNGLIRLRRELRLPATLAEAGIAPRDLRRNLGIIVEAALADPCCRTNPVEPTRGMLEELLTEVAGRG